MLEAITLGLIQGITEWLPVSSEGVIAGIGHIFFDKEPIEAIFFALWLHMGTALAAIITFNSIIKNYLKELVDSPGDLSPTLRFLICSCLISGIIGGSIILILSNFSNNTVTGIMQYFMTILGVFMTISGIILMLRKKRFVPRILGAEPWLDSVIAGSAQGLAVIPGLSRSGLTISALLVRKFDTKEALTLSFLMSIPASIGAGLIALANDSVALTTESVVALTVSFITGLLVIKGILRIADQISFGPFIIVIGLILFAGSFI